MIGSASQYDGLLPKKGIKLLFGFCCSGTCLQILLSVFFRFKNEKEERQSAIRNLEMSMHRHACKMVHPARENRLNLLCIRHIQAMTSSLN